MFLSFENNQTTCDTYKISYIARIENGMDTKLTLKLDEEIIQKAKIYASEKNTSLSKLIESYLELLVNPQDKKEVTPLVKSLSGVLNLPKNHDPKKEYQKHIKNKYSK
jgi:hypothetical protein